MDLRFPTDTDGYLSQECPSCNRQFKAAFGSGSDQPIGYCPYCGHAGSNCWFTDSQVAYVQAVAEQAVVGPALDRLAAEAASSSRGLLTIKTDRADGRIGPPPNDIDVPWPVIEFKCCRELIKAEPSPSYFCVICGAEVNMESSLAKRVFLSHKGEDKELIRDFKTTLEYIGYDPWLDEDAMPAGTSLERGLLRGVEESCAAVFFITPAFQDKGYLKSEIDYAIQRKRKMGDQFSIITLQFEEDGNKGEVPELLQQFVWKHPQTRLEALREIIRALPIKTGPVSWRDSIGVLADVVGDSTTTELSEEAAAILLAAVEDDGRVMHSRYMGGESLHAGRKSMISDPSPRTVAKWLGGLEDLLRRRFIKDLGHKGEVSEVTREGFSAADQLSK